MVGFHGPSPSRYDVGVFCLVPVIVQLASVVGMAGTEIALFAIQKTALFDNQVKSHKSLECDVGLFLAQLFSLSQFLSC